MAGCCHRETVPVTVTNQSWNSSYSSGKCWIWNTVEKEYYNRKVKKCYAIHEGKTAWCMRKKGHKGKHHFHGVNDCYMVWK